MTPAEFRSWRKRLGLTRAQAAAREGIAYVATVTERDGRRKRVLGAATPSQVHEWMATCGLADVYGDPARGFAGGYL